MRKCRNPALAPTRGFDRALRADGVRIIAEVKRASPSKGYFHSSAVRRSRRSSTLKRSSLYFGGDQPDFFHGSLQMLAEYAFGGGALLRKDFIVETYQIYEARLAGADAILLIVAALDDAQLSCLLSAAADCIWTLLWRLPAR